MSWGCISLQNWEQFFLVPGEIACHPEWTNLHSHPQLSYRQLQCLRTKDCKKSWGQTIEESVMKWGKGRRDQIRTDVKAARCGRSSMFSLVGAGSCCSTGHHYVADILQTHLPLLSAPRQRRNGVCSILISTQRSLLKGPGRGWGPNLA